jgi:hypothetical protein
MAHGTRDEGLPDDRSGLDDRALVSRQAIESRGEEGLDRRRDSEVPNVGRGVPTARLEANQPVVHEHR